MIELTTSTPQERTGLARQLSAAMGADPAALGGVLLELLDRVDVLLAIKDAAHGRYLHVNKRMAELLERPAHELVGLTDAEVLPPGPAAVFRSAEQAALAQATHTLSEHRLESRGVKREFTVTRVVVPRSDSAAASHLLSVWVENTAAHQREHQLAQALAQIEAQQLAAEQLRGETQDQSLRDGATGLYLRMHFDDQLRREVDLSSREHREFALVSIALDPLSDTVLALGGEARTDRKSVV